MSTEPLKPFVPPSGIILPVNLSPGTILTIFFWFAVLFWAIYTLIAVYHWLKYSHASTVAYPAIAVHLVISFLLISYAFSGIV